MKTHLSFIEKVTKKDYLFRRIFTLDIDEWKLLAEKLCPEWKKREIQRLSNKKRIHQVGQGRPYELGSFENLLLLALFYWRTNAGYELMGLMFDIDPTTVKRAVKRISVLLVDRFIPDADLNKRKRRTNKLDDLLKDFPESKDVIFDGTEMPVERPKKRQKEQYSGKKKRHTKKVQIALDGNSKLLIGVSLPGKGKTHGKKQLEQIGWDKKLSSEINRYGDSGFQGMAEGSKGKWTIPHKKPKGAESAKKQKRENKKISKKRIPVEHSIRGVKIFKRIGEAVRIKSDKALYDSILAATNSYNFKRLVRQGLG